MCYIRKKKTFILGLTFTFWLKLVSSVIKKFDLHRLNFMFSLLIDVVYEVRERRTSSLRLGCERIVFIANT